MRRTPMPRRRTPMKRGRSQRPVRVGTGIDIAKANKVLFKDAARDQRCCQMCGSVDDWDAHHVVYEQHCLRAGQPAYSTPNALRLCKDCHGQHHKRRQIVPTRKLTQANIDYAFYALGAAAIDYLSRYYDNRERDERIERAYAALEVA